MDSQAIKLGFSNVFWGDQCEARTVTARPITLKKKRKNEGYQTPSLANKDEGAERGVTESPCNSCVCREATSIIFPPLH